VAAAADAQLWMQLHLLLSSLLLRLLLSMMPLLLSC
jgi:hypothetical protein